MCVLVRFSMTTTLIPQQSPLGRLRDDLGCALRERQPLVEDQDLVDPIQTGWAVGDE